MCISNHLRLVETQRAFLASISVADLSRLLGIWCAVSPFRSSSEPATDVSSFFLVPCSFRINLAWRGCTPSQCTPSRSQTSQSPASAKHSERLKWVPRRQSAQRRTLIRAPHSPTREYRGRRRRLRKHGTHSIPGDGRRARIALDMSVSPEYPMISLSATRVNLDGDTPPCVGRWIAEQERPRHIYEVRARPGRTRVRSRIWLSHTRMALLGRLVGSGFVTEELVSRYYAVRGREQAQDGPRRIGG
ncbi:hypothetical protein B0H21DRAFT_734515 [Amylocystis lapponica]|nr:hypothetical protein B0H21DRAFT_734515 [Amylocystis lapponica]